MTNAVLPYRATQEGHHMSEQMLERLVVLFIIGAAVAVWVITHS